MLLQTRAGVRANSLAQAPVHPVLASRSHHMRVRVGVLHAWSCVGGPAFRWLDLFLFHLYRLYLSEHMLRHLAEVIDDFRCLMEPKWENT